MQYMLDSTKGFIVETVAAMITVSIIFWLNRVLTKRGKHVFLVVVILVIITFIYYKIQ